MPYSRSEWYHLYLNGQYWGLYQTQERTEAEYAASYLGGLALNYDVIKPEAGPYAIYATDGNLDAWGRLWTAVGQNQPNGLPTVATNSEYLKLQGRNLDGSDNMSYEVLLDVDNLANYMIGILYGGNLDAPISAFLGNERVNNFFAIRDRTSRQGFKYFLHDSEHTLRDVNENRNGPWPAGSDFNYSNPQWLHQRLMTNDEYRLRFADLVQKHFFYDGALSVTARRIDSMAKQPKSIKPSMPSPHVGAMPSVPNDPLRHSDWVNAVNGVNGGYFPLRVPTVSINSETQLGMELNPPRFFPSIDAPTFLVNGNICTEAKSHQIVLFVWSKHRNRLLHDRRQRSATHWRCRKPKRSIVQSGVNDTNPCRTQQQLEVPRYRGRLGSAWRANGFDDSGWLTGNAELGYGDGDEATVVSFGPDSGNKYITTYFRKNFAISDISSVSALTLRLKRDDGAVVISMVRKQLDRTCRPAP